MVSYVMTMKNRKCVGWEIVCPDGSVRHHPYHNEGDARSDARTCSRRDCEADDELNPVAARLPPCPQGVHSVRLTAFLHSNRGVS